MSAPIDTTKVGKYNAIQNALCELLSAESSLHMYPEPIKLDVTSESEPAYLSATDANAKHALEHMHAAFMLMNTAHHDQEILKMQVYRLTLQIRELGAAPIVKTWLDDDDASENL